MDQHSILLDAVIFLAAAVVAVPLFKRLGLGSVLGYLAAGSIIGPAGFGAVTDYQSILHFAEFGVVLLLFIIGLELNPGRLWSMRRPVFGLGGAQVVITGLILAAFGYVLGLGWPAALAIGWILSFSSTAFALQLLEEKEELSTLHGRLSFAILLFQDIAVIPLLAILPLLGGGEGQESGLSLFEVLRTVAVIALVIIVGRFFVRHYLRMAAQTRSSEVFNAATLLLVIGVALLMDSIGLSMALGSFLAGVLLADSEYRHELEADIEPFKGLLLGLFFIAVGMSVDYRLLLESPLQVAFLVLALVGVKFAVLFVLGRVVGLPAASARNMAFVLPQGGEFAFVLFEAAAGNQLMDHELERLLVVTVCLSMAVTPFLSLFNERLLRRILDNQEEKPYDEIPDEAPAVLIAGFGRFGQIVARVLRLQQIGFTVLERSAAQVEVARKFGSKIYYGDAGRLDLLESAGAARAKLLVLAIDETEAAVRIARLVRSHFPDLKIFARARNRSHTFDLMDAGVHLANRETLFSSLEVGRLTLMELGFSEKDARSTIERFREHDEMILKEQYRLREDEVRLINFSKQAARQLEDTFRADSTPDSGDMRT